MAGAASSSVSAQGTSSWTQKLQPVKSKIDEIDRSASDNSTRRIKLDYIMKKCWAVHNYLERIQNGTGASAENLITREGLDADVYDALSQTQNANDLGSNRRHVIAYLKDLAQDGMYSGSLGLPISNLSYTASRKIVEIDIADSLTSQRQQGH